MCAFRRGPFIYYARRPCADDDVSAAAGTRPPNADDVPTGGGGGRLPWPLSADFTTFDHRRPGRAHLSSCSLRERRGRARSPFLRCVPNVPKCPRHVRVVFRCGFIVFFFPHWIAISRRQYFKIVFFFFLLFHLILVEQGRLEKKLFESPSYSWETEFSIFSRFFCILLFTLSYKFRKNQKLN